MALTNSHSRNTILAKIQPHSCPIKRGMDKLNEFVLYLSQQGLKKTTIYRHIRNLKRLESATKEITYNSVMCFLLELKNNGAKATYLNSLISTASVYSKYIGLVDIHFKRFKIEPFMKATMSDSEIEAFLSLSSKEIKRIDKRSGKITTVHCDPVHHQIMTVFWSILAFTGMRPSELAEMTVDRVDFGRGVFVLEETKTHAPRYVPIADNILPTVLETVKRREKGYLFPSRRSKKTKCDGRPAVIDSVDWGYDFHDRLKRLGIMRKNLTPYSLRHSFITTLLEEDVNLFKVQKIVGHKRTDTTAAYTHLTTKDIKEAIKKHPTIRRFTSPQNILYSIKEAIGNYHLCEDHRFSYELIETDDSLDVRIKITDRK